MTSDFHLFLPEKFFRKDFRYLDEHVSVLSSDCLQTGGVATTQIQKALSSNLPFLSHALCDPRFDILTPQVESILEEVSVDVQVDFMNYSFQISNPRKPDSQVGFKYAHETWPIVRCFETGIISGDLSRIFEQLDVWGWKKGKVQCLCTDHLTSMSNSVIIEMEVKRGALVRACSPLIKKGKMSFMTFNRIESEISFHDQPDICLDPNPNVARVMSLIDFRKKQWVPDYERYRQFPEEAIEPHEQIFSVDRQSRLSNPLFRSDFFKKCQVLIQSKVKSNASQESQKQTQQNKRK